MSGNRIPDGDHVVRHVRGGLIENGEIGRRAFFDVRDVPPDPCPSVNWLECFRGDMDQQVESVRRCIHRDLGASSKLAVLPVSDVRRAGQVKTDDKQKDCDVHVVHDPLEADDRFPWPDPSHCQIHGLPNNDGKRLMEISRFLLGNMIKAYPAQEGT